MSTSLSSEDIVGYALKFAAGIILFLLSLGIKDIRDRLRRAEEAYVKVDSLYALSTQEFTAVKERVKLVEERLRLFDDRLRLVEDRLTRIEVFVAPKTPN